MRSVILLLLCLPLPGFGQAGKNFVDSISKIVSMKESITKVRDNVYLIRPQGKAPASNITLYVGSDFAMLVDNQWSKLGPTIDSVVSSVTIKPIKYTVDTHFHFDHSNGNTYFGMKGAEIIAHKNLAARLAKDQNIGPYPGLGMIFQRATQKAGLPSVVFSDSLQISDKQETITMLHFRGAHTDGDVVVHFRNGDIFCMGDIFVTYGIPFIDENNGGDIYETIAAVESVLSASGPNTRVIPGHGPVCAAAELTAYKNLLIRYKDLVVERVKKGYSLEKIVSEVKIDENIGGSKQPFIPHIYRMALKHENLKKN